MAVFQARELAKPVPRKYEAALSRLLPMTSLRPYFRERSWALGLAASIGLAAHCARPSPPARTLEALAVMLGQQSGGVVDPQQIAWEPSPGFWTETFAGRRVLFLSRPGPDKPRDLYRAQVRLTLAGQPLAVTRLSNITQTPLGDETALDIRGNHAVFATVAFGRVQSLSVLDVDGIRAVDRSGSPFDRLLLAVSARRSTGSFAGIGRTDLVLDVPAGDAKLTLDPPLLAIDFNERGRELRYDVVTRVLRGAEGAQAYAARAVPQVHRPKPLLLWTVDTVRDEVGPEPIAWLENRVFGAKDTLKRTAYALFTSPSDAVLKTPSVEPPVNKVLDASKLEDGGWPPPPIASLWQNPKPGEGQWQPVTDSFLEPPRGVVETAANKRPAYFYTTFIRPDAKRPYSELMLIALDMRQLELGMQGGYEDPKPLTGPAADGRIPQRDRIMGRVVATFNGAFKTTHGEYGMMVDRHVLLPPVAGGATVLVTNSGEVGLGSWPKNTKIPDDVVSYRQNLDPLIEDGVVNPAGRFIWGWQLEGTSVMTQRTALCLTPAGHLYYAFGSEIDGPTLATALKQAGCSYALHLDMNPSHCGFVFSDVVDAKKNLFNLRVAHPDMKVRPEKFLRWSPKDFFYVLVRDATPSDPSGLSWTVDGAEQPPPAWIPGVYAAKTAIGNEQIELMSFEKGRVDWSVRAGSLEPSTLGAPPKQLELPSDDKHRVLAAIGLGHTTEATRYGLAFGSRPSLELRSGYATLVLEAGRAPEIRPPGFKTAIGDRQEAVQLPLLAEEGQLTPRARERGPLRARSALCVTSSERVVVGQTRHDSSDALATALVRAGCKRVVELDRGSLHPGFVHRTGSPTPPVTGYETSVLYALGRPMSPHAFRWKPQPSDTAAKEARTARVQTD